MTDHPDACDGCALPGRRAFLRDSTLAVTAIALGLGVPAREAAAWTLSRTTGRPAAGGADSVTYPIPPADGAQIDRTNQVILVRYQGTVYAFNLACPHRNVALEWFPDDHIFQCPKHHSRYQPDGTFISGRATRGMDRLAIRRDGGSVVVDLDTMFKQDEDPAGWNAAKVGV
jgi:nitrite reductase/ring-hydroxylating ferredoxin subunit